VTLHITPLTPHHVVSVYDRLIYAAGRYLELADDRYKHFVLICDDAKVAVSFAGFAGVLTQTSGAEKVVDDTLDWLTSVATDTSRSYHDLDSHLNQFRDAAKPHLEKVRSAHGIPLRHQQLAIQICGWKYNTQFNCVIENYMNHKCEVLQARESFTTWIKTYDADPFDAGSYVFFLGQRDAAMRQTSACAHLNKIALTGDPKRIFKSSVALIRAAAKDSPSSIGGNCSGLRLTGGDPGIEVFDDRPGTKWDVVMPNVVKSTSGISCTVSNIRGMNTGKDSPQQPLQPDRIKHRRVKRRVRRKNKGKNG
jgi:hypothetical protein